MSEYLFMDYRHKWDNVQNVQKPNSSTFLACVYMLYKYITINKICWVYSVNEYTLSSVLGKIKLFRNYKVILVVIYRVSAECSLSNDMLLWSYVWLRGHMS